MPFETDTALTSLDAGNRRFIEGRSEHRFSAEERAAVVDGQQPWAVVVGCSDSRVPVEAVFDVGVGELFIVRSAGNVVGEVGRASIRFAVEVLGATTVVVLGHEDCGAVKAALSGSAPAWLAPVTDSVHIHAPECDSLPEAIEQHIRATGSELRGWLEDQGLAVPVPIVVGGVYSLGSGEVRWLR